MNEKRITVYCGSSNRVNPLYLEAAAELGRAIARAGATLVYGAGRTGLMGAAADAALAQGGAVEGIIPTFMVERGWHHSGLTELVQVDSMHTRKARMMNLSNAVIALPGGIGTFEELTEAITWRQLGLFGGNVVIYDIGGYYHPLVSQLHKAAQEGFMGADHMKLFHLVSTAEEAVEIALREPQPLHLTPKF